MFGSVSGTIVGISYFVLFQILGIIISICFFHREKMGFTILMGSVLGSFSLQWLPALFAFFVDFSVTAHLFALFAFILITAVCFSRGKKHWGGISQIRAKLSFRPRDIFLNDPVLFLLIPLYIFVVIMSNQHTLPSVDGSLHCGQSTYGDMNMHLGFITSLAKQQIFPPEYSLLPGTKLAYPFLSDSISSSIYIWGSSLRAAYLLPMYVALLQVFFGMYALTKELLFIVNKSCRGKSILAFVLFFFNGGFGFCYFINKGFHSENFRRIFTEFYKTPTNYVDENIQWHNIICDMLIPQRATLFGWAILFPLLLLLVKARKTASTEYFILGGVLAGGLVLIHTHSFLALGVICAVFLLQDLYQNFPSPKKTPSDKTKKTGKTNFSLFRLAAVAAFVTGMSVIGKLQLSNKPLKGSVLLMIGCCILAAFAGILAYSLRKGFSKKTIMTWGIFLGVVIVCALPQLLGFTFQQAQGEQFVRGSFNWANEGDGYLIFYIKNLGIMFILSLLMLIYGSPRQIRIALPGCLLWLICEFILFQPNPYDNNKLLLVAYLFFCIAVADFVWETIPQLSNKYGRHLRIAGVTATAALASFAALLTLGREYVSDYELYDKTYVEMCQWIEENTEPTDIFLTADNHNNAVASLTGRNIVCGSGTFLYFHGIDYAQSQADAEAMYQDSTRRDDLLEQHEVDYIVLGSWEWGTYQIPDIQEMYETYDVVYNKDGLVVLAV